MQRNRINGFFVTYALFGIALFAMIGAAMGLMYKSNQQSEGRSQLKEQLQSDAMLILQQITNCVVLRPGGNNGDSNAADRRFPAQTADQTIGGLTCPAADPAEQATGLWAAGSIAGTVRLKAPSARNGYSDWKYLNTNSPTGVSGVRLFIEVLDTQSSDAIALLNSFRMRSDMSDYFPDPVVTSVSPARLYSISLSQP